MQSRTRTYAFVLGSMVLSLGCSESGDSGGTSSGTGAATSSGGTGGTGTGTGGTGAVTTGGTGTGATAAGGGTGGVSAGGTGGQPGSGGTGGNVSGPTFVYVGSGNWSNDSSGLITVYELDREGKTLEFVSDHDAGGLASFLALSPDGSALFSADENNGGVIGFSVDPTTGMLGEGQTRPHGNHPVHLSFSPDGAYLLAANYSEGNVDVYPVTGASAGAPVSTTTTGNNAHSVVINAEGDVLVANKGSDTINRYTFNAGQLIPADPLSTTYTGARHVFFGPDGRAYVVSENADQMSAFNLEADGSLSPHWTEARLPDGVTATGSDNTGADIQVTPSGKFVYATNRSPSNTIVAYDISTGVPQYLEHESTRGTIPRNFAIDPEEQFVIVGNRESNSLAIFEIQGDGSLEYVDTEEVSYSPFFVGAWHL